MASRCEHCKHFIETWFKGQSRSGYGCWAGDCHHPTRVPPPREERHSLMLACGHFEAGAHPRSLSAAIAAQEAAKAAAGTPAPGREHG